MAPHVQNGPAHPFPTPPEDDVANKITEDCSNCGACEAECPNQAISQGDDYYVIDAAKCDECKAAGTDPACMGVCPTDSIVKLEL
jgi:ferredoxin